MDLTGFKARCASDSFFDTKDQLRSHINRRTLDAIDAGHRVKDRIRSIAGVERRKAYIRKQAVKSLGGLPKSNTPLNAAITGTTTIAGIRVESVVFESRPKNHVTCLLYLPPDVKKSMPSILFLCGHHREGKNANEYISVCSSFARAGFPVLAMDPFGQGERLGYIDPEIGAEKAEWGVMEHSYAGCQCLAAGDSIARYFVHDAMRAIDYMCARPEIDASKIAVTGNSGGGTQTCLMMMCDPRIAAAIPVTFLMSRESYLFTGGAQDSEQVWTGTTAAGMEHDDILIAMAPKPVLVQAVRHDFFPVEGTIESVRKAKRFWSIYGQEDHLELFIDDAQHNYTKNHVLKAVAFLKRTLCGESGSIADDIYRSAESDFTCTVTGQVATDHPDARWVFDENLKRIGTLSKNLPSVTDAKLKFREMVFKNRTTCALFPKKFDLRRIDADTAADTYIWWAQTGICGQGILIHRDSGAALEKGAVIAVWSGGIDAIAEHGGIIGKFLDAGKEVFVLDLSGEGGLKTNLLYNDYRNSTHDFYGALYKFAHDLFFLGDSLAAMRTYEIIRAVDLLLEISTAAGSGITLYSEGRHSTYGAIAAFIDERIDSLQEKSGRFFESCASWAAVRHYDRKDIASYILPGMLAVADLPEIRKQIKCEPLEK